MAQWLEHPTGIWGSVGLIPAGGSDFFSKHFYVVPNTFSSLIIALVWLLFYILLIKIMQLGLFNYGKF